MSKEIRVARVIDNLGFTLALNVGSIDGVKEGDQYLVYVFSEDDIIDPTNGQSLGKLEIVKGRGKVTHIQEHVCTIESTNKKRSTIRKGGLMAGYAEDIKEEDLPFDSPAVGDFAKKIN